MKLYLDDCREPYDNTWTLIKEPRRFMLKIVTQIDDITEISFDHDIETYYGDKEITWYDLLDWTLLTYKNMGYPFPKITIHTANPPAWERMCSLCDYHPTLDYVYKPVAHPQWTWQWK